MRGLLVVLAAALTLLAPAAAETAAPLEGPDGTFTIQLPEGWTHRLAGKDLVLTPPEGVGLVSVASVPEPVELTPENLAALREDLEKRGWEVTEDRSVQVADRPAWCFTLVREDTRCERTYVAGPGGFWMLVSAAPAAAWDEWRERSLPVLASFTPR